MSTIEYGAAECVLDHIDRGREEIVETLQRLIRFPTLNPPGDEREHQEFVATRLHALGIEPHLVEAVPGRPSVVVVMRGSVAERDPLDYAGHADVVTRGDAAHWRYDPFGGEVHDYWLYGRGAVDHKALIAASLAAVKAIVESGVRPSDDVVFTVPVDEW